MQQQINRVFRFEDVFVGCVALIAAVVCALALFGVPTATATRGVSYTGFVRAPAVEESTIPATPIELERPRMARLPAERPVTDAGSINSCSPVNQAELRRLLRLCQG